MVVVKLLPKAEKDFDSFSESLQDEILYKMDLLSQFPQMGPKMEKAYKKHRYLLVGKNQYRLIYKITSPKLVDVAYIRHCRRQMGLRLVQ
ncbi:MAG: type II toxin-antitoxin system RelE/ParE family toxin [Deltaproteobacteria bacterium]|nr:type II toxin-antitoxin system RelE/ParE family toxin [Deltaproteobacteria bacterium]